MRERIPCRSELRVHGRRPGSEGQEAGGRLAGWFWLWVSQEVTAKVMARAVGIRRLDQG